jgi:hypothetical protein
MAEPDIDLGELIAQLSKNAEAGTALVTVAVIDEWLQKLLLAAMRRLSNTEAEKMFGANRFLYDVAPKADIAYAFRLLDEETYRNLRAVKAVRDLFAHTSEQIHFNSPEIIRACQALPGFKKGIDTHALFIEVSHQVVRAIDAKTNQLIFESAASRETP